MERDWQGEWAGTSPDCCPATPVACFCCFPLLLPATAQPGCCCHPDSPAPLTSPPEQVAVVNKSNLHT